MQLETKIRRLTARGLSQKQIAEKLGLSRGTVHRRQKQLGLSLGRHGPRCEPLTPHQEKEISALLCFGFGTGRIAALLGTSAYLTRKFSEKLGFRHKPGSSGYRVEWDGEKRENLIGEIEMRTNYIKRLAAKFGIPYSTAKKMAHTIHGVPLFLGGTAEPMLSPFPMNDFGRSRTGK